RFAPRRHDDSPQHYLGRDGVHDLDSVVAAIVAQPAMPTFIAATMAQSLLGTTSSDVVGPLAAGFVKSGFDVRTLVRSTLQAGLAGSTEPVVLGPVRWLVAAQRVTGATVLDGGRANPGGADRRLPLLSNAGQVPMMPPNVAGWPGGAAWFGSASLVARCNLAMLVARSTVADSPVMQAARGSDPAALAQALSLPSSGFGPATSAALSIAPPGVQRLALALTCPEVIVG
ncbi:MAG: DUF1800 family protein, partial [Ilumatobacteraceae bacterium]